MRVLLINYEYPPLGGGTAIANEYLVKEFKQIIGLKLDILTASAGQEQNQRLSANIRLIRLNIGKNNYRLQHQSYLDLFRFFWLSTTWVLQHKQNYNLIHAFSGLPGSITAWLSGRPYLVSFRGADEPSYEPRHEFFWIIIKPLMYFIYRRAQALDANSRYLKKLVLKSFPSLKIKVINNGIDTGRFYPAKKPVTKPIILCTSRLGQRKGIEYLIRALALIPRAELWLAGGGLLEPKLKQLVKKLQLSRRVKFLGPVPHDKLPVLYRQAKIFVLPSLSESQSNSLLEAIASGLPVVATNVGGNPESVNKNNGLLVPPADSQALAAAVNSTLSRDWPKISPDQHYSWKITAKRYWQLYRRLSV